MQLAEIDLDRHFNIHFRRFTNIVIKIAREMNFFYRLSVDVARVIVRLDEDEE